MTRHSRLGPGSPETTALFTSIVEHREQFFGNYRGLKVLDSGTRSQLRQDIKAVKAGTRQPSPEIFQPVIQRVEDRLLEMQGGATERFQGTLLRSLDMEVSHSSRSRGRAAG